MRANYPKRVGPAAMPTGAAAAVYTAPERVVVNRFTCSNTTAGELAVTIHVVVEGGAASVGNQIAPALTVPANDTISIYAPVVLERGEKIFALANGAVNLTFNVNDRETTGGEVL